MSNPRQALCGRLRAITAVAVLGSAAALLSSAGAHASPDAFLVNPEGVQTIALEDFSAYAVGGFPRTWKVRGSMAEAQAVYRIAEDGRDGRFLTARADGQSIMIGLERPFEPARYPYLRWRWRVRQLPVGADERDKTKNDSAAGVYVIFPGKLFVPRVLKYVWSTTAPVGMRQPSPAASNTKIIVLESGVLSAPAWRTATVNVERDYLALFGSPAPTARGIGVLTDGNDTGTLAEADYAGFELLPQASEPPDSVHAASAPVAH
jgi:hypothetical protein